MEHPLDNPTWFALVTKQTALARRKGMAIRYDPAVSPFAAVESVTAEAFHDLETLLAPGESVLLQTASDFPSIDGLKSEHLFAASQMIDVETVSGGNSDDVRRLSADDAREMVALAKQTAPGPFSLRTVETGRYIGIREAGRLIAMAGERMRLDGFVEISAVCVDDEHRGQGIAGRLMNILRHDIRQRGDVPFLHVRGDNVSAIGLYRRIGFEDRKTFSLYRVTRQP